MRCPNCGNKLPRDVTYCRVCGARFAPRKRSRAGRVVRGIIVALIALALGAGGAFAYTWYTGPHPLRPTSMLDERSAQIVGHIKDYPEQQFEGMTVYFSSEEFRDLVVSANESGLLQSSDWQISSQFTGEHYIAFMGSDGSCLTIEDLRDGKRPQGIAYVEVVRNARNGASSDEAVDCAGLANVLQDRGIDYTHVLAVNGDGLGMDLAGEYPSENMVSALYYGESFDGVSAITPTGPTSMYLEVATEQGALGAQDILGFMNDADAANEVLALLGADDGTMFYE